MPGRNHIPPTPVVKVLEEEAAPMKQGIVTILRSDCEKSKAGSIRRTLSADMSSKKWLEQNGSISPMKKIVSSEGLVRLPAADSSSSWQSEGEFDEIPNQNDVWRSIQAKKERDEMQKPAQGQVWGSILSQKSDSSLLPPPYVHPLVKRSSSTLSEKSLEICTEKLGSETGSDRFSSEILSDGDGDEDDRQRVVGEDLKDANSFADLHVAKYKKSPAGPFPPPLPSIAGGDGASLHMYSHRENGRLVLEAVSVPPRNYFHAQRQDGRLVLTLIHASTSSTKNDVEEVFDNMEEVGEDIQEEDGGGDDGYEEDVEAAEGREEEFVMEQNFSLPSGMVRVHKSGLVMKKLMAAGNINPTWSKKADELIMAEEEEEEEEELPIPQSLPPPPRAPRLIPSRPTPAAAASFNAYEYFWRNKTTVSGFINPIITNKFSGTKGYENQDLLLMKNKTEQFFPYLRGCKDSRRSLLIWEPYCIATS